jgi:hypothetical protein
MGHKNGLPLFHTFRFLRAILPSSVFAAWSLVCGALAQLMSFLGTKRMKTHAVRKRYRIVQLDLKQSV